MSAFTFERCKEPIPDPYGWQRAQWLADSHFGGASKHVESREGHLPPGPKLPYAFVHEFHSASRPEVRAYVVQMYGSAEYHVLVKSASVRSFEDAAAAVDARIRAGS